MENSISFQRITQRSLSLILIIGIAGCTHFEYRTQDGSMPNPKVHHKCNVEAARAYPPKYEEVQNRGYTVSASKTCNNDGECTEIGEIQVPDRNGYSDMNGSARNHEFRSCMEHEGHVWTEVENDSYLERIMNSNQEKQLIPSQFLLHPEVDSPSSL